MNNPVYIVRTIVNDYSETKRLTHSLGCLWFRHLEQINFSEGSGYLS